MSLPVADPSLFFVCRFCTRMAEQMDKGQKVCALRCGGPRKGMTFPLYEGPVTRSFLKSHCYVCFRDAEMMVAVKGIVGDLGICKAHLPFAGVDPASLETPPKPHEIGVIQTVRLTPISFYDALGIDPVRDLGFEKEKGE